MLKKRVSYVLIVLFIINLFMGFGVKKVEAATIVDGDEVAFNSTVNYDRKTSENKYYKVNLKQGEYVSITGKASLSSGSVSISIVSSADLNIKPFLTSAGSDTLSDGKFASVDFVAPKDGYYYIKITGNGYGRISLTAYRGWQNPEEKDEKRNFSSTFNTAKYISDGTYNLESDTGSYINYYRFVGQADVEANITITANISSSTLYARIFDLDGNAIANQYIALGNGSTKTMKFKVPIASVYYLKVYGAVGSFIISTKGIDSDKDSDGDKLLDSIEYCRKTNPTLADTDGDGTDDYSEIINKTNPLLKNEYTMAQLQNAASLSTAIPAKFNEFVGGQLTTLHYYKIELVENEIATILLRYNDFESSDIGFTVYDQYGKPYNTYSTTSSNYEHYVSKDIIANRSGTFYIAIPNRSSTYGNYELGVFKGWRNVEQNDDARTYFGDYSTAKYLKSGTYSLENRFDDTKRYFRFMAKEGDKISINMKLRSSYDYISAWIADETLNPIKYARNSDNSTNINNGDTGVLQYTIPADGFYYFCIGTLYSASFNGIASIDIDCSGIRPEADSDKDGVFDSTEYWRGTDPNKTDSDEDGISDYDELKTGSSPIINNRLITEGAAGDTKGNAIEVKEFGKNISTKLDTESDSWFKFDLLQGQQVIIDALLRVSSTDSFYCYLRDENGNLIQNVDGDTRNVLGATKGYKFSYTASKTATYYLEIKGSSLGKIDLKVMNGWRNPYTKDSDRGYDYTYQTSKYISDGRKKLPSGEGNKYFRFTANANNIISIQLKDIISSDYIKAYLVDKDGNKTVDLANPNDKSDTNISSNETAVANYKVPTTGVYYLVVSGKYAVFDLTTSGINQDTDSDGDGVSDIIEMDRGTDMNTKDTDLDGVNDYEEYSKGSNPLVRTEFTDTQVNNAVSLESANELNYFNSRYSASTSSATTWYKINMKADQTIEFVSKGRFTTGNVIASICDEAGNELSNMKTNIESNHYSNLTFKADKDGYYYIKVVNNKAIGNYWFAIYNGWESVNEKDENRDYYSSFSTAKQFSPGRYTTSDYGVSYFRINGKKDDTLKLGILAYLTSGSLTGKVYDQNQNVVANFVTNVQGNAITNGMTSTLEYKYPSDGVYYIQISGNNGDYELTTSNNLLSIVNSSISDGQKYDYSSNKITLSFNQSIAASNINAITYTSKTNEVIKASVSINGNSAVITPVTSLNKNTQYTLNVPKDAFSNVCGANMEKDYVVKFSTVCTDVNQDGVVDMKDLAAVAYDYEKTVSDSGFDTNKDINGDKIIDIFDLVSIAREFN